MDALTIFEKHIFLVFFYLISESIFHLLFLKNEMIKHGTMNALNVTSCGDCLRTEPGVSSRQVISSLDVPCGTSKNSQDML